MKTFDLEKALNTGKALTRDGREVTQLTRFDVYSTFSLRGVLDGNVNSWTDSGDSLSNKIESNLDLQNIPEKLSGCLNIYNSTGSRHDTLEEAIKASQGCRGLVARIDLSQFSVGHGLEDE